MKFRFFSIIAASLIVTSSYSQETVLKNRMDSLSYAIGVSMHNGAKQFKFNLDYNALVKGVLDAEEGDAVIELDAATEYIQRVMKQVGEAETRKTTELGYAFLKENAKTKGVVVTQSGLQYIVIKQGLGPKPLATDRVKVNYAGYLLDGTKFDSSEDRGGPAVFNLNSVIEGWKEAVQLMPVGSEYVIWVPAHLAYGDRANGDDIVPGSTLMFEIELLDIVKR